MKPWDKKRLFCAFHSVTWPSLPPWQWKHFSRMFSSWQPSLWSSFSSTVWTCCCPTWTLRSHQWKWKNWDEGVQIPLNTVKLSKMKNNDTFVALSEWYMQWASSLYKSLLPSCGFWAVRVEDRRQPSSFLKAIAQSSPSNRSIWNLPQYFGFKVKDFSLWAWRYFHMEVKF